MTDNAKIIEVAALMDKVYRDESEDDARQLHQEMARLEAGDSSLVLMVSKLMAGGSYSVNSNDPENIRRHTLVAKAFGATVESSGSDWPELGLTSILITPPVPWTAQ